MKDKNHSLTMGMSDFWITDELWVNSGVNTKLNVLAESYSDPLIKGRGMMEPTSSSLEFARERAHFP